jgi:hypothetical protein
MRHNRLQNSNALHDVEKDIEDFLVHAGVDRAVAEELSNTDDKGRSAAPVFLEMAEALDTSPSQMFTWLNGLDPESELKPLVEAAHGVDPNDEGQYPASARSDAQWEADWRGRRFQSGPESINGLILWARSSGYDLPG